MANTSTPFALQSLLEKMSSPDSDFRFMSLNDLLSILTSPNASLAQTDSHLTGRVIDGVVKALDDANGEVQNLAVKWYVGGGYTTEFWLFLYSITSNIL